MADCFPVLSKKDLNFSFWKQTCWWIDKTISLLGYRKISWFVSFRLREIIDLWLTTALTLVTIFYSTSSNNWLLEIFSTVTCTTRNFFFYLISFLHVLNIFPVLCFLGPSTTASHGNATTEQLIGTDVSPKLCDALHVWWKCTRHQTTLFQQNGTNISLSCFSSFNLIKQTFSFSCRRAVWNVT